MKSLLSLLSLVLFPFCSSTSFAQSPSFRDWTSTDGKTLQAEYLGIKGDTVALRLQDGKEVFVPMKRLSAADNTFIADHRLPYLARWDGWPADAGMVLKYPDVKEEKITGKDAAVYTTPRFRFHCDVSLGTTLMNDLARIFELTYHLHANSPFGIQAEPENDRFEAKLRADPQAYHAEGASVNSAGCYLTKERIFLARLDLMGLKKTNMGWRKVTDDYDPSTIVHEMTHMLTHDMLEHLPLWINEGYAEYISNIPYKNKAFQTSPEKIREGMRNTFIRDYAGYNDRPFGDISTTERSAILRSGKHLKLPKIASILDITDQHWNTGLPINSRPVFPNGVPGFDFKKTLTGDVPHYRTHHISYYRAAHLILYYFIQIEGENGIAKLRRNLALNRARDAEYRKFLADFKRYEADWEAFCKKPGVVKLSDGSIEYPAHLLPPKPPAAPLEDPNLIRYSYQVTKLK